MKALAQPTYTRRLSGRFGTQDSVWVYWRCNGRDDVSRVRDMSMKGLFVETEQPRGVGATIMLDFLVQEGQIRAQAAVQHVKRGAGLGLKLMAVTPQDGPRLAALTARLCEMSQSGSNVRWANSLYAEGHGTSFRESEVQLSGISEGSWPHGSKDGSSD